MSTQSKITKVLLNYTLVIQSDTYPNDFIKTLRELRDKIDTMVDNLDK